MRIDDLLTTVLGELAQPTPQQTRQAEADATALYTKFQEPAEHQRISDLSDLLDAEGALYDEALDALERGETAVAERLLRRCSQLGNPAADDLLADLAEEADGATSEPVPEPAPAPHPEPAQAVTSSAWLADLVLTASDIEQLAERSPHTLSAWPRTILHKKLRDRSCDEIPTATQLSLDDQIDALRKAGEAWVEGHYLEKLMLSLMEYSHRPASPSPRGGQECRLLRLHPDTALMLRRDTLVTSIQLKGRLIRSGLVHEFVRSGLAHERAILRCAPSGSLWGRSAAGSDRVAAEVLAPYPVPHVGVADSASRALDLLLEGGHDALPVGEHGTIQGIVTLADLAARARADDPATVSSLMRPAVYIKADTPLEEVRDRLLDSSTGLLIVLGTDGTVAGYVTAVTTLAGHTEPVEPAGPVLLTPGENRLIVAGR